MCFKSLSNTLLFVFETINYNKKAKIAIDEVNPAVKEFFKRQHEKAAKEKKAQEAAAAVAAAAAATMDETG